MDICRSAEATSAHLAINGESSSTSSPVQEFQFIRQAWKDESGTETMQQRSKEKTAALGD